MTTWTRHDEQQYKELTERRAEFERTHGYALLELCQRKMPTSEDGVRAVYALLRDNAGAFRDALAPFDSGVRQVEPEPSVAIDEAPLPVEPKAKRHHY